MNASANKNGAEGMSAVERLRSSREFENDASESESLLDKVKKVKDRTKRNSKKMLIDMTRHGIIDDSDDDDELFADAAFNPAKVINEAVEIERGQMESKPTMSDRLKSIPTKLAHPRRALQDKSTKKMGQKIGPDRQPNISSTRDKKLLHAYDDLTESRLITTKATLTSLDDEVEDSDIMDARDRINALERERENLQTAWVMRRYVDRVKAVEYPDKPRRQDFVDEDGSFRRKEYLCRAFLYQSRGFTSHYVDDFEEPPFDIKDFGKIMERLAISSGFLQAFYVEVRGVYRWDDWQRTSKWAILFCCLWYKNLIPAFLCGSVAYFNLRNKFRTKSIHEIRQTIEQSINQEAKAKAWGDLIQQRGENDWIQELLEAAGPALQLLLMDLANATEVWLNFSRDERPDKTAATLFFLIIFTLTFTFADVDFLKMGWLLVGFTFFISSPISSVYPKYRLLFDWSRWVFWDIPTHAELAILRLQQKAAAHDARRIAGEQSLNSTDNSDSPNNYSAAQKSAYRRKYLERPFHVYHSEHGKGQLVVDREGIKFEAAHFQQVYQYSQLAEMRKLDVDSKTDKIRALRTSPRKLQLVRGKHYHLANLDIIVGDNDLDKIFNLILAWSGLKWQSLQPERHKHTQNQSLHLEKTIRRAFV